MDALLWEHGTGTLTPVPGFAYESEYASCALVREKFVLLIGGSTSVRLGRIFERWLREANEAITKR